MPRRTHSLLVLLLLVATAVFASAALAEMPSNREAPTITEADGPIVGDVLLGNNGTWLYADGSSCRGECAYAFAWFRCAPGRDCSAIPGGTQRAYRVGPADVGSALRVAVTATKYDCNAHGQDCRNVSRTAVSPQTASVAAPAQQPRLAITRVAVERARRGVVVSVRVTDGAGRAVRSARVTIGRVTALTGSTGSARIALRTASSALSIRADKPGAEAAVLDLRVPLAR